MRHALGVRRGERRLELALAPGGLAARVPQVPREEGERVVVGGDGHEVREAPRRGVREEEHAAGRTRT